jgi:V/A-type H+-transporting ATPase subunit I
LADWPGGAGPSGPALPDPAAPELAARIDAVAAERRAQLERRARLGEESELVERYGDVLDALAGLVPALAPSHAPYSVGLVLRGDAGVLALLREEAARLAGGAADLQAREVEPGRVAVLLTVPQASAAALDRLLFERHLEEIKLPPHLAGGCALPDELRALDAELAALAARWRPPLEAARREARRRLAILGAERECGLTRHAFVLFGWVPRDRLAALAGALRELGDEVAFAEHPIARAEYALVPVVLRNRPWLQPFELLLALVPPPRYGSIDPTPYLAVFFPLLFGLVLGDVGFGLVLLGLALLVRRRGWFGAAGRRAAAVAAACAASAIGFGVLFGELFGELGAALGLHPIIMDRQHAILPSLALALAIGTVHILVGIVLGIVDAARARRVRELLLRVFRLALLLLVPPAAAAFTGMVPISVAYVTALVFAGLLLAALVSGGPLGPIELVLTLGNVLSYARLMALGLASVLLAGVANRIAVGVAPAALGISIAVLLHAANFTLGLISPTVCALRLQYVEFFDKFYEEGGRAFRPFGAES